MCITENSIKEYFNNSHVLKYSSVPVPVCYCDVQSEY